MEYFEDNPPDLSDAYARLERTQTYDDPDTYECIQCGGPVNFVRNDIRDHIEVEYYRCQDEQGCRQGGERVYDRAGELIRTAGPVFDDVC